MKTTNPKTTPRSSKAELRDLSCRTLDGLIAECYPIDTIREVGYADGTIRCERWNGTAWVPNEPDAGPSSCKAVDNSHRGEQPPWHRRPT